MMTREEAIQNIKKLIGFSDTLDESITTLFPELKESEDEKMIGVIRLALTDVPEERFTTEGTSLSEVLAWLEKQKYDRMKPIYDVRESFESALEKAWNDYHNGYENADKLEDDYVECAHAKGFREGYLFGIEKQKEQKPIKWSEEDSRILYNVIAYIGYAAGQRGVRDDEFKEANSWLKSLPNGFIVNPNYNEDMVNLLVAELQDDAKRNGVPQQYDAEIAWLKSLRPQPKPEWSKEDESMLNLIITDVRLGQPKCGVGTDEWNARSKAVRWLKSLPERFNLQPKQGWNGDDNVLLNNIINIIQNKKYVNDDAARKIYVDFLKSLRPKHEIHKEKTKEPKHTEVWVEGRTIFEQDANTFVNTEGESEAKLTGWVARDKDEKIWVYETCPEKYSDWQQWVGNDGSMRLDQKSFPDLKWEDEPVEVEITIRKK